MSSTTGFPEAYFRVGFGVIQRSKGGSALRASAYERCSRDPEHDFSHKAREFVAGEVMLPPGTPSAYRDPLYLWSEAEKAEKRKDAQLGRTFVLSIPYEIPEHLRIEFCRVMFQPLVEHGFAVEWCRHRVPHLLPENRQKGTDNDHVHALASLRRIGPEGFSSTKDRGFNDYMLAENGQVAKNHFAERINKFLARHDIHARVSPIAMREGQVPVPEIDKRLVLAIHRWQRAVAEAEAEGRPVPTPSAHIQAYIDARQAAIAQSVNRPGKDPILENKRGPLIPRPSVASPA